MAASTRPADGSPEDTRVRLTALRDRLTAAVAEAAPRDLAPLAARLTDVLDKLAALPAPAEGTPRDELAQRRAAEGRPAPRRTRTTG